MGLFDDVKCRFPLPDSEAQDFDFQSKETPLQYLGNFEITKEGRLFRHKHPLLDEDATLPEFFDCNFHGYIRFYTGIGKWPNYKWYEYGALFKDGNLIDLRKIEEDKPMTLLQRLQPRWLREWRAERAERYYWRKATRNDRKFDLCWIPNCDMCPEIRRRDHAEILLQTRAKFHLPDTWTPKQD